MEKEITIDGKKVPLKVTMNCVRMYKAQFGKELMRDVYRLKALEKFIVDGKLEASDELVANIDFEMFLNLLWVFAKKADETIPPPAKWEDKFSSFPIREILPEVMELLTYLLEGQKKTK